MECFSGVQNSKKGAQNSKKEGGIERKKACKCEAEGKRWSRVNFTSRNNRRMQRETASKMASLP